MISIDTVYQRVLTLANKEQRGYITPQEFNLLANQAQMEIFEQYFYDIAQYNKTPGNDAEFSDYLTMLNEKVSYFEVERGGGWTSSNLASHMTIPGEVYRLGRVRIGQNQVEMLSSEEFDAARISYLTAPTEKRPIAYIASGTLTVNNGNFVDATIGNMNISYIRKPETVKWGYTVITGTSAINGKALWDSGSSTNFELHTSEEAELVYRILGLAGITINKPGLDTIATNKITAQQTQEKQ
jgi:hypothetical protein